MTQTVRRNHWLFWIAYSGLPSYVKVTTSLTRYELVTEAASRVFLSTLLALFGLGIWVGWFFVICLIALSVLRFTPALDSTSGVTIVPEPLIYILPIVYVTGTIAFWFWKRRAKSLSYNVS